MPDRYCAHATFNRDEKEVIISSKNDVSFLPFAQSGKWASSFASWTWHLTPLGKTAILDLALRMCHCWQYKMGAVWVLSTHGISSNDYWVLTGWNINMLTDITEVTNTVIRVAPESVITTEIQLIIHKAITINTTNVLRVESFNAFPFFICLVNELICI